VFVLDIVDLAKDPFGPVDGNSGEFHFGAGLRSDLGKALFGITEL